MDIIDIMLAKALTPQGQTDIYVNKANKAAAKAEKAESDAAAAIAVVTNAAEDITAAQEAAGNLLETAQDVLETAQQAQLNIPTNEDIDAEVKKLNISINTVDGSPAKTIQLIATYPDNTLHTENITKLYKNAGNNEDGTMTQKAIKTYIDNAIASVPHSGGNNGNIELNFDVDDAGHILVIDENGHVVASNITENMLIEFLLNSADYVAKEGIGVDLNYADKTFTRIQKATNLSMGDDFNRYLMYGGRVRCNVADNGTITAFYGDSNYRDDGSNGQVMIYQPKFYYRRIPHVVEETNMGKIVRHESLIISTVNQPGFKLAPIFGDDLDYVLLPAYDGSLVNDKLASIANASPVTNITVDAAEQYAQARGEGWHIVNLAALSTNQMLEIVEFGMMNGQTALEKGIISNPTVYNVCTFITGSTADLGSGTGHANSTQMIANNNTSNQTADGYRAISYRGMENPWGNIWQMIAGVNIYGNGSAGGGTPYVCTSFNYNTNSIDGYESVGFVLPASYKWLNAMGLGDDKYDWVFLPIECSNSANSLLPIGDTIWTVYALNGINMLVQGGSYGFGDECGPFCYGTDRKASESALPKYGAKLMFIPTKNSIYQQNIAKWTTYIGG